jgi:hypothetical protein
MRFGGSEEDESIEEREHKKHEEDQMRKGYCSLPRWHTMLIARVLFFAISVVPSSSDNGIVVPRADEMLRQGDGGGSGEPPLERVYIRVLDSKSAKSKSSKVGLKSGSKGSKSKAAKSKSGKSKSAKAKSAKAKSAKTMPLDAKIKSGKGKGESEKSVYSHKSEDSLETESSNDNEISSSDTETENIAAASTETSSLVYDSMEVEGDAYSSASGSVSSKEGVGIPRSEVTTSSSDGVRSNRTDVIPVESEVVQEAAATANLEGGFSEERIEEDTNEDENHDNVEGDPNDRKFDSSDSSSQARIADISYYSFEEDQSPLDQVTMEATNLESESNETKIEKDESLEKLDEADAVLDFSRESLE